MKKLILFLACISLFGCDKVCEPNVSIPFGNVSIVNNMWGKYRVENEKKYEQCIYTTKNNFPIGWYWNCNSEIDNVKGFPQILYGQNPYSLVQTTEQLPIHLSLINNLFFNLNAEIRASGNWNQSIDMWVSDTDVLATIDRRNITHEIMIWFAHTIPLDTTGYVDTIIIHGTAYELYRRLKPDNTWYIMFVQYRAGRNFPLQKIVDLDLNEFFKKLYEMKFLSNRLYLDCAEFGTEIWYGIGSCKINNVLFILNKNVTI